MLSKEISFVWAEDLQGNIGYKGKLPWRLPNDLKFFKEVTSYKPIVMGRKTFESFPNLLPNRLHVVLTRNQQLKTLYRDNPQVIVYNSVEDIKKWMDKLQVPEVCIIGGAEIFDIFVDSVTKLYRTQVNHVFNGDTKMIPIDYDIFNLVLQINGKTDKKNIYPHTFQIFKKKEVNYTH